MNSRAFMLWIAGAAGVILIYSAYKNRSVTTVFTDYATGTKTAPSAAVTDVVNAADSTVTGAGPVNPLDPHQSAGFVSGGDVFDASGNYAGPVPASYAGSPGTYVPGNVS